MAVFVMVNEFDHLHEERADLCDWGELSLDGKSRGHCPDGCEEQHKEQFDLEDLARESSNQWQWAAPNCSSGIQHIISIPSIQI